MKQDWLDFLATRQLSSDREHFGNLGAELVAARDATVVVPLVDQDLIRAAGPDAPAFLHNLLTNDVENLPADEVRFAGMCTAKGRLLATCHLWHEGPDLLLAMAADIQPALLKKLSMFILRSKVTLADPGLVLIGLAGSSAPAIAGTLAADGVRAVPVGGNRHVLALTPAAAIDLWPRLAALAVPAGLAAWRWLEIAAGQPRVVAATQEAFVPQMVNMELPAVGGVIFTKGCYPGQEIVARTQYLGKVKRRMYRARIERPLPPGTEVFTTESGDQHCGALVTVAPSPEGGHECLVVVQSSGIASGGVFAGRPGGPPRLTLLAQPYEVG